MRKAIICAFCALMLTFGFTGCGTKTTTPTPSPSPMVTVAPADEQPHETNPLDGDVTNSPAI